VRGYDLPLPRGQALVLLIAHDFRLCLTITAQKHFQIFFVNEAGGALKRRP
jgi:hypothetical protein